MTPKQSGPAPAGTGSEAEKHKTQSKNTPKPDLAQVLPAALALLDAGFSVLPVKADKRPRIKWERYQSEPMTPAEAGKHFVNGARLAVVCGTVSGNLECLDFDDPEAYAPFLELLALRCPGLPEKLLQRQTPSGGYHLLYRCADPVSGNLKLASSKGGEVRIETRGEGGYFISAPSPGYEVISGRLTDCPTLTGEEVQAIHDTAKTFDRKKTATLFTTTPGRTSTGDAPGDLFNQNHTADEILKAQGWKPDRKTTAGMGFTRPGKDSGTSGVLLEESGNFYCWSSNAAPLEPGASYSPFALYAAYNHGGDFSAAARELRQLGYGTLKDAMPVDIVHQKAAVAAQAEAKKDRRLRFVPASELTGFQEPIRWTVKGYIEAGTLITFFAPPESLKTFVLLDMGCCISAGKDWHGHKVESGPVLYVCGEGRRGIGRRLQAWEKHNQMKADRFFLSSSSAQLLDETSLAELEAATAEVAAQHGNPALIIVDTLNRNFGPGDENNTTDMTRFIAALDRLRERLECAVAVVHHTGIADTGRGRGSSALRGALDFEYLVKRNQDRSVELLCSKCKDHERPPTVTFQPVIIDLGMGDEDMRPITSLALERIEGEEEQPVRLTGANRIAFEALKRCLDDQGIAHIDTWRHESYVSAISTSDKPDSKQKAFNRASKQLLEKGLVETRNDLFWLTGQTGQDRT